MVAFGNLKPRVCAGDAEAVAAEEGDDGLRLGSSVVFFLADEADVLLGFFIWISCLGSGSKRGYFRYSER